jgi:adenylate cyclase class 2
MMSLRRSLREIEIKLSVPDVRDLRRRLAQLHARVVAKRTHEFNTIYDTPRKSMFRKGRLIRIRIDRPVSQDAQVRRDQGTRVTLTIKGPAETMSSGRKAAKRYKIREEVEATLPAREPFQQILRALGLRSVFRYEKFRTTYAIPGHSGVKIEFDETPVGNFLELEGSPRAIDSAAMCLGYAPSDYNIRTYGDLYKQESRRRGQKHSDMLFMTKN